MTDPVVTTPEAQKLAAEPRDVLLHPLVMRKLDGGEYAAVRFGGRTMLRMREDGWLALQSLRRNGRLSAARAALMTAGYDHVDLTAVVHALVRAGLVRRIDGQPVASGAPPTLKDYILSFWRCVIDPPTRCAALLDRLPCGLAISVGTIVRAPSVRRYLRRRAAAAVEVADITQLDRHARALARQDAVARAVCRAAPRRVDRWLHARVDITGLEHVVKCRDSGQGVILAALHHGPFAIIPPKVLSVGIGFHGFYFGPEFARTQLRSAFSAHEKECGWAHAEIHPATNSESMAALARALRNGGCALVLPDFFRAHTSADTAHLAQYRGINKLGKDSEVTVELGAERIRLHTWIGWLARTSGARVLPVTCHETPRGRYAVTIGASIEVPVAAATRKVADAQLTAAAFTALSAQILAAPHEWTSVAKYPRLLARA